MNLKELALTLILFIYSCRKDLFRHSKYLLGHIRRLLGCIRRLFNSKTGRILSKSTVIITFLFFMYYYFLISGLIWLKFELSVNGLLISFCSFIVLNGVTAIYFNSAFNNLFFSKNNTSKPFTIVKSNYLLHTSYISLN